MERYSLRSLAASCGISERTIQRIVKKHRDELRERYGYDSNEKRIIPDDAVDFIRKQAGLRRASPP